MRVDLKSRVNGESKAVTVDLRDMRRFPVVIWYDGKAFLQDVPTSAVCDQYTEVLAVDITGGKNVKHDFSCIWPEETCQCEGK